MSEKLARNFILGLSKKLKKEDFASLVSYFSITQGKGSTEIPDLRLFPELDSEEENARLINRVKAELNYLGISVKRFNQGVRVLEKLENIKDNEINSVLLDYIKNKKPYEEWFCLEDKNLFDLTFSSHDKGCFCRTTTNRDEYGNLSFNQERSINIDLLSLAKITQAIHLELNISDIRFEDTFETIIHTAILHEKEHLLQRRLDETMDKLRQFKRENEDIRINLSSASNFAKFYLQFEYDAWEFASEKDLDFYRRRIINEALCNMSLVSYIVEWLSEIYFNGTLTLPHEDTTFEIDPNAPDYF